MDASGEYVSETGRVLGSRVMPGTGALDEQAQTGGAADIRVFPSAVPASGFRIPGSGVRLLYSSISSPLVISAITGDDPSPSSRFAPISTSIGIR